jgi:hypothetical protein
VSIQDQPSTQSLMQCLEFDLLLIESQVLSEFKVASELNA